MEKRFNLLDEPWVLVRKGVKTEKVSLVEVFKHAHEFDALACELPTVDVAILRLSLAVLYAVFSKVDVKGNLAEINNYDIALSRWRSLWYMKKFPIDEIADYLNHYKERFWLCHPEKPFFQVAGLKTIDGRMNPIVQIIADVPSRDERRFFTDMNGQEVHSLSFDEAARWLVHLQAWDYAGKKASVVGGTPNGGGTGWCGKLGIVYPQGRNLFETLLLNFVLTDSSGQCLSFSSPAWEQVAKTASKTDISPNGYVELLTWQSRRTLLFVDGARVTGVISSYGDVFAKENISCEQMSGWHISSLRNQGLIPNTHDSSRSMWRDLGAILPRAIADDKSRRPGVLDWIAQLGVQDNVRLCAVGYEYGAMQGVVDRAIADSLSINAALFAELGTDWVARIVDLLEKTDKSAYWLGVLASDLDKAAGGDGSKSGDAPKEHAYFALDEPFRTWLAEIDPAKSNMDLESNKWKQEARRILARQGDELVAEAGDAAFVGRDTKNGYLSAPKAEMKFKQRLNENLGGGG